MEQIVQYPATIITGFLGAGKTTLLNRLIKDNPDKKFAIIENEFGDINIDSDLVVKEEGGIYELSDGCVCCSLNDELANTLATLHESDFVFNHLLVETTGIADPNGVAASFFDPYIRDMFFLDGTICLADAEFLEDSIRDEDITTKQISFSDVILLNKIDRIEPDYLEVIKSILHKLNPTAKIIPTENSNYGKENLLELDAYQTRTVERTFQDMKQLKILNHKHDLGEMTSFSFTFDRAFDLNDFQYNMSQLIDLNIEKLYRIKGIVNFKGHDRRIIFQTVRGNGLASSGSEWGIGEKRESKFVFIGKGLDKDFIAKLLEECLI